MHVYAKNVSNIRTHSNAWNDDETHINYLLRMCSFCNLSFETVHLTVTILCVIKRRQQHNYELDVW